MSIATLFTIAKNWKQPKCSSSDKWVNKMWNIHTKFYYLAIKRSTDTCMDITHGYCPPSGREPVPLGSPHVPTHHIFPPCQR